MPCSLNFFLRFFLIVCLDGLIPADLDLEILVLDLPHWGFGSVLRPRHHFWVPGVADVMQYHASCAYTHLFAKRDLDEAGCLQFIGNFSIITEGMRT